MSPPCGANILSPKRLSWVQSGAERTRLTAGLGNLKGEVDWGYAPDYIEAMHRIVNLPEADDFVIATGKKHTVEDFVRIAFDTLGLDWQNFVEEKKEIITRPAVAFIGNSDKLVRKNGWKRTVTFLRWFNSLSKKQRQIMSDKKILVMIPTYNEHENVKKMCHDIR